MTAVAKVIADLSRAGVALEVSGDRLRFQSAQPLTDDQRRVIVEHKAGILAELSTYNLAQPIPDDDADARAEPPAPAPLPRTAPIYSRLLALAPAAGQDEDQARAHVGVRQVVLSEYADQPDALLVELLRGWARERPALCATCGPVWLPRHWPASAPACPWCSRTRAGLPVPRPPFGP